MFFRLELFVLRLTQTQCYFQGILWNCDHHPKNKKIILQVLHTKIQLEYLLPIFLKINSIMFIFDLHVWHQMVFLVRVNEEGGDSKSQEDESPYQSDHPHRDLLGNESTTNN